jgi:hypothetical protein
MFRRVMLCALVALATATFPLNAQAGPKRNPSKTTRTRSTRAAISLSKARQVFQSMAGQRDISFAYPADGCYARAHLMVRRMQRIYKITPYKVWSFANGESLYVRTPNIPSGHVTWKYHVAPAVWVRLPGGKERWYVIDPSMFHGPVTLTAWKNGQRRPGSRREPYTTVTRLGVAPVTPTGKRLPGSGYWTGSDPREGLDHHANRMMAAFKPLEGRMPPARPRSRATASASAGQGRGQAG